MVSFHRLAFLGSKLIRSSPSSIDTTKRVLFPLFTFSCAASQAKTTLCSTSGDDIHGNMESDHFLSETTTTGYLNAEDAYQLDLDLFSSSQYTLEQLMELAGLSVAEAVYTMLQGEGKNQKKRVLVICGPGNNGGDGLVAARHLMFFGYYVDIIYPTRSKREVHYEKLLKQCLSIGASLINQDEEVMTEYDGVVDAIFGFSFSGIPREPFKSIIENMMKLQRTCGTKVISVDIPSGWNVNEGDLSGIGFVPDALVSLTAPKLCSRKFHGRHFIGGRFLPDALAQKYSIRMPKYSGVSQIFEVDNRNEDSWATQYAAYCAEKESTLNEDNILKEDEEGDWKIQYHQYVIEKETQLNELNQQAKNRILDKSKDKESWEQEYQEYLDEKNAERQN